MTLGLNANNSVKVETRTFLGLFPICTCYTSNKNIDIGTAEDDYNSSVLAFFLLYLAWGHTALQDKKNSAVPPSFPSET